MRYEYNGKLRTVKELAEIAGVSVPTMYWRLTERRTVEEAVHMRSRRTPGRYRYKGEMLTVREISERTGYTEAYLYSVLKRGLDIEDAVAERAERRSRVRSIARMLEYAGIPRSTFYCALHRGVTLMEFFYGEHTGRQQRRIKEVQGGKNELSDNR